MRNLQLGRSPALRVLLVQLREPCSRDTGMDDDTVAEPDVLPRLDREADLVQRGHLALAGKLLGDAMEGNHGKPIM